MLGNFVLGRSSSYQSLEHLVRFVVGMYVYTLVLGWIARPLRPGVLLP